jgi:hypothetical protein
VHECGADALTLLVGQHAEWTESERWVVLEGGPAADDVPDHLAVQLGDQRE